MNTGNPTEHKRLETTRSSLTYLRRYLLTGTAVMAPLAITLWVLWQIFSFIDGIVKQVLGKVIGGIPGVGVIVFFLVILLIGIFATNIIGKRMISFAERIMARIPLANKIYAAVQQISSAFLGSKTSIFNTVVLMEYPRKGIYSMGFVTSVAKGEVQHKTAKEIIGVFVPTTPNPTSGLLVFVPKEDLIRLDMSPEDGLKLVISGGVFTPAYKGSEASQAPESQRA